MLVYIYNSIEKTNLSMKNKQIFIQWLCDLIHNQYITKKI